MKIKQIYSGQGTKEKKTNSTKKTNKHFRLVPKLAIKAMLRDL